jgi:formate dehydrogenase iron-sulfur subunit
MLAPAWWSPVLPVSFFLSSIAAGTAVIVLLAMWAAKGWRRPISMARHSALGQITFWSLLVYLAFRVGDLAVRGQFASAFSGRLGVLLAIELGVGGVVPLLLLGRESQRANAKLLFAGALLTALGIVLNRTNVVLNAMNNFGTPPYARPESYSPSLVEWGVSIGLIAATVFLFGAGARLMPLLPKKSAGEAGG